MPPKSTRAKAPVKHDEIVEIGEYMNEVSDIFCKAHIQRSGARLALSRR